MYNDGRHMRIGGYLGVIISSLGGLGDVRLVGLCEVFSALLSGMCKLYNIYMCYRG